MTPQERARYQASVELAFADGAEIEYKPVKASGPWLDCTGEPSWDWRLINFRVKKPAPKVVKLEAWIAGSGQLFYYVEGHIDKTSYKRIPSLDLEYVEDES